MFDFPTDPVLPEGCDPEHCEYAYECTFIGSRCPLKFNDDDDCCGSCISCLHSNECMEEEMIKNHGLV